MDGESQKATQILRPSATKCATALNASFVLLLREGTQNGKYVTLTNAPAPQDKERRITELFKNHELQILFLESF